MANLDLSKYGIKGNFEIVHNPSYEVLFQDEMNPANEGFEKAKLTKSGATAVYTGKFTGRSPKDKYFVKDDVTKDTLWWDGTINRPCTKPRSSPALESEKTLRGGYLLRNERRYPHESAFCDGSSLAGSLRNQHVHPSFALRTCTLR